MIFNSISLENFGIVKKFSKKFDKKIIVLAGENGEGKSTILKAILLAVFDDYEGVLSDYVNWDSDYFQVIVNFTHRGVDYESVVKYDGSTDRTLRFGDKVLKGDEAKKKIKEIVDIDLLKAGMLAMEQEIAIVKTKPAERREYLKRIYDIEFKRQLSDLDNDIRSSEIELAKKVTLQTEIENRHYNVPEKPTYPFGKSDYDLLKANLEIERNKYHTAEEQLRLFQQTQVEISTLNSNKTKLDEDIKKVTLKIDQNNEKLLGLPKVKCLAVETETVNLNTSSEELKIAAEDFANEISDLNKECGAIVLERLPQFASDRFEAVSQELYAKKTKLTELQLAKDTCPMCGQSITSAEHIEKRAQEITALEQQIKSLSDEFTLLSEQKTRRETVEKNNLEKTNKKTALQNKVSVLTERSNSEQIRIQAKIDQSSAKLDRLDSEYAAEETKLKELISADSDNKNNLVTQIDAASEKLLDLNKKINEIKIVPVDSLKAVITKIETDIRSYDDVATRIMEIEKLEIQIEIQMKNNQKQLEELKTEIQVLNQLIVDWKTGIKILKTEFPVYVISRVIKNIEKAMNEFLKRTYPKYQVEVQDKKNALHIVYGPKKKDVSSASGFERQIFSLSFMYAISHAIGNRCLLLDECDSAATDKNSGTFYKVIGDAVGQGIDQIILISHKPTTRNVLEFDYNAEVIVFDKGVAA